ncbi:metal dependent phosphohydrolase [Geothermobacter ehrlichii]|uniref:Metal dependent phosphohydrolase n=1 Tax=Geothermobacter ehrlichii TaxID=213224 RepID=A0A5D3WKE2_9BACT|nr:HD domain-containing protein [Geothermobacter ehrlichii]TYO98824.1 metal dependent phosphohydrolase [Geothermobacter ehrlichii]
MKQIFASAIGERDWVESVFLVREKVTAMAKNGKPYLTLKLMDRSGEIEGRVWDRVDELGALFDKDDFVRVRGRASSYLGRMQLVVQELVRVDESEVDFADFLPVCEVPVADLEAQLRQKVDSLKDPHLRRLMESFVADADFLRDFCSAPAAKSMHHVYLGGLLEHSLSIAGLVDLVCGHYPFLNRDLLLVGALLHDVGKIFELRYSRSFDYTDEGKLLGHIVMGVEMVDERIAGLPDFPRDLAVHLKHLLLSHHGQYEYGSPKRPKTLEAVVLNYLDDLDSKLNGIRSHISREQDQGGNWTSYHRLYERYFFKGEIGTQEQETKTRPRPPLAASGGEKKAAEPKPRPARKHDRPLSFSLGEQLRGKNLDLFATREDEDDR